MIHGDSDYALARVRARVPGQLRAQHWQQVGASRSVAAALGQLRSLGGAAWVDGLGGVSDPHLVEAHLRARFRDLIDELAGWADPLWQPALRWCAGLVDLPAIRHSRIHGSTRIPPGWSPTDLGALAAGAADKAASVDGAWCNELRRRMPRLSGDDRGEFEWLLDAVAGHRRRFSALAAGNGWPEREDFQRRLKLRQRRNPLSPVHLLGAVALIWLDHERVRGELLRLAALPAETRS